MAARMNLNSGGGVSQIMNVSAKIGTEPDCVKNSNDVEAVQCSFYFSFRKLQFSGSVLGSSRSMGSSTLH